MKKFLYGMVRRTCGRGNGGDGANIFNADGGNNTLMAGAGDDQLNAGGGNNYLDGGDGSDTTKCFSSGNLVVLLSVDTDMVCDNAAHHVRGNVLFGRGKRGAANDTEGRMAA